MAHAAGPRVIPPGAAQSGIQPDTYDLTIKEIIVSGDLAAVRLVWTLTVKRPGQVGGTATTEPGLDLFRRQGDGTWKIVRYLAYEE